MALDTFNPYLFVSSGEQSNKFLKPTYADGIAKFQAQRAQQLTKLLVQIDPVQSGSGDPSPSNIRPISGRTGMTVTRAGKNLFYGVFSQQSPSQIQSSAITLPAGTYTYSQKYNGTPTWGIYIQRPDGTEVKKVYSNNKVTFTLPTSDTVIIRVYYGNGITPSNVTESQIEAGSTATAYEPYKGTAYPITWQTEAGEVYGGTLDVVSGVLTVDWDYIASYDGETLPGEWISDRDVYAEGTTPTTGAEVAYKLAEPVTYQLDPEQVMTAPGFNQVYSDAGPVIDIKF